MKPQASSPDRSRLLGRVRQRDTGAELAVGKELRALGLRYRKNVRSLAGSPDFANLTRGWAIFVQGCFWHAHTGCSRATVPRNNREFWLEKFARNRRRDAKAIRSLRGSGLTVLLIWECEIHEARRRLTKLSHRGERGSSESAQNSLHGT